MTKKDISIPLPVSEWRRHCRPEMHWPIVRTGNKGLTVKVNLSTVRGEPHEIV